MSGHFAFRTRKLSDRRKNEPRAIGARWGLREPSATGNRRPSRSGCVTVEGDLESRAEPEAALLAKTGDPTPAGDELLVSDSLWHQQDVGGFHEGEAGGGRKPSSPAQN